MLIASVVLLGAVGVAVGLLAKSGPSSPEGAPPESCTAVPEPKTTVSDQLNTEETLTLVRSRAEKYIAAINAKDEPTAAQYTCRKKDASLLWVAAAGRKITLLDLEGPFPPGHQFGQLPWWSVSARIRIEGRPSSPAIVFALKDGEWCVHP